MLAIPEGYEIARPSRSELATLPEIEVAAASIFSLDDLPADLRADADPPAFFEQAHAEGRLWVARSLAPPATVGFAVATVLDGSAHLQEMDVLPDHGRRGIGRALVARVAHWAEAAGFRYLTLTTFRHLPWNAPFYASMGFREIAERHRGPQLRAVLEREADEGLNPSKRIAMQLKLGAA